jgi:hypothetical protein
MYRENLHLAEAGLEGRSRHRRSTSKPTTPRGIAKIFHRNVTSSRLTRHRWVMRLLTLKFLAAIKAKYDPQKHLVGEEPAVDAP